MELSPNLYYLVVSLTNKGSLLVALMGIGNIQRHLQPLQLLPRSVTIQLLPEQKHVHLVEVKHCEDTRPKIQLKAAKQQ
eukprot:906276-Pelagomonas_calceolata.AAC.1